MANINKFHNEAGAVFKDDSVTVNVQQNFGKQNESPSEVKKDKGCESTIRLADSFAKVDLQRVIIALIKLGAFETDKGTDVNQKEVFEAFSNMLGTDLSKYSRAFSDASYNKSEEDIFRKLENAFRAYEAQKAARKESLK